MHVALIDPSRVVLKIVSEMLIAGGHTAVAFTDSGQALAHVEADPTVACVLTSLEVQPICGLELCWSLRALADDRRPLTILVMSSAREERSLAEVLDSGADDFLTKPIDDVILFARVKSLTRLKHVMDELREKFDWVICDSPAGIERGATLAMRHADVAVVVTNPEVSSVRDSDRIIGLLEAGNVREIRLVINRLRPKMVASGNMLSEADMLDILGVKPIGIIPEDEGIIVSTNVGEPAVLGNSASGQAFLATAQRIRGQDVPYPSYAEDKGFWAAIKRLFGGG
mgnify:CR=1 FL=1